MDSSASAELGAWGPILVLIVLAGLSLALIWLFAQPQHSNGGSLDDPGAAQKPAYPAKAGGRRRQIDVSELLKRWGCFSRPMLRLALHYLSNLLAVISFAVLAGAGLALLWRWIAGR